MFLRKFEFVFFQDKISTFAPSKWEFSSVGSEHLPYKQRVTGSNPVTPTAKSRVSEVKN
jgi:hypothetical protein